jgi:hypothetical protein
MAFTRDEHLEQSFLVTIQRYKANRRLIHMESPSKAPVLIGAT